MNSPSPQSAAAAKHEAALLRAERGVAALAQSRNDRWYPAFHIASDGGWINDPNGLCYYHGRWHVFYQLHPFGTQWGPMHWGHVSSADMVTWRREPIALAPSLQEDRDGIFSGSAAVGDDDVLRFYYTGHRLLNGVEGAGKRESQLMAQAHDENVERLDKLGVVIPYPNDRVDEDFRDPKVWKMDGIWYMIVGARTLEHRGQIWLYSSADMITWTFAQVLFEHPDPNVFMLECPDFFPLTDARGERRWILGFSAMGAEHHGFMNRNVNNAGYLIGSWTPGTTFEPSTEFRPWDCGHNFYAPQSFSADGKRQILYGWMSPSSEPNPMQEDGWCGQLTLPREVTLGADGDVHTAPVEEMRRLRADDVALGTIDLLRNEERVIVDDARTLEIDLVLDLKRSTAERMGIKVHATNDGDHTYVAYDDQIGRVVLDRRATARGDRGYRTAPLDAAELSHGLVNLQIFLDHGSVEVYVNDGHQVLSSYSFPSPGPCRVILTAESGTAHIAELTLHHLNGIGLD